MVRAHYKNRLQLQNASYAAYTRFASHHTKKYALSQEQSYSAIAVRFSSMQRFL